TLAVTVISCKRVSRVIGSKSRSIPSLILGSPASRAEEKGTLPAMPNHPQAASIMKDPVTWLYPSVEPYNTGRLQVSPVHEIYFEESGNPTGRPVIFLHGG